MVIPFIPRVRVIRKGNDREISIKQYPTNTRNTMGWQPIEQGE